MGDTDQQRQESINPSSRQYRINHQDWRKSKAQVPGFEEDRSPPRGRGRGWRARGRDSPKVGTTQTGKETSGEEPSQSSGKDAKREKPSTRKDEKRLTDEKLADAEMIQEQREQDWKIQVERRKEDERRWEEDRGWKWGDNKYTPRQLNTDSKETLQQQETLRQQSADNKESSCTEKSRKSRRAAQEVYVPRARRQAQAVYIPRAKRLQMEADEKSTEALADKEVKKTRVTREPPEKKRQVASQRQQRSSGRHETRLEKSVCKSHTSDYRLKTDRHPDTRSDEKLAGKPLRTDESQNTGVSRGSAESSDAVPRQSSDTLNIQLLDCPEERRKEDILTDECFKLQEMKSGVQDMQSRVQDQFQQYSTPECVGSFTSEKMDVNHHIVVAGPSGTIVDHIGTSQEKEATNCPNLSIDEQLLSTNEGHYSNMTQETVSSSEFTQQRDNALERGFIISEPKVDTILTSGINCTNTDIGDTSTVHIDKSHDGLQGETLVRKDVFEERQVPVCDVGNDSIGRVRNMEPCPSQESCSIAACQINIDSLDIPSHSLPQCDAYISADVEKDKEEKKNLNSNQKNREVEEDQECRWIEYVKEEKETVFEVKDVGLKDSDKIKDYNMKTDAGSFSVNVAAGGEFSGEPEADLADDNIDQNYSERLRPNVCADGLTDNTHETMLTNANENKTEKVKKSSDYASDLTASTSEITNGSDTFENVKQSMDQAINEESGVRENGAMVTDDDKASGVSEGAFLELDTIASNTDGPCGNMSSCVDKKYTLIQCMETDTSGDDAMQEESTEESSEAADADIEEDDEEAEEMLSSKENGMDADGGADEDASWDAIFDESGESLKLEEVQEIAEGIGKVKVSIKKAKHDYYNYQAKDNMDYSAYEHVIEIYDFPVEFKTPDFIMAFSDFKNKGFDIKWVDDTHALAIFATPMVARDALTLLNPMFRTRPLARATRESKMKAKQCIEFLQPYKSRPETTAFAARRLVSGALGLRSRATKEQREAERKKLREAKDKKRADRQQTQDIWEGNI